MTDRFEQEVDTTHAYDLWQQEVEENLRAGAAGQRSRVNPAGRHQRVDQVRARLGERIGQRGSEFLRGAHPSARHSETSAICTKSIAGEPKSSSWRAFGPGSVPLDAPTLCSSMRRMS